MLLFKHAYQLEVVIMIRTIRRRIGRWPFRFRRMMCRVMCPVASVEASREMLRPSRRSSRVAWTIGLLLPRLLSLVLHLLLMTPRTTVWMLSLRQRTHRYLPTLSLPHHPASVHCRHLPSLPPHHLQPCRRRATGASPPARFVRLRRQRGSMTRHPDAGIRLDGRQEPSQTVCTRSRTSNGRPWNAMEDHWASLDTCETATKNTRRRCRTDIRSSSPSGIVLRHRLSHKSGSRRRSPSRPVDPSTFSFSGERTGATNI
ncbi:hypothetical protein C8Q70DRAFT_1082266 [Cubamyces menziesii]|nr:hypothetical protein C8Q70DRAFT_1082266 [Cubamyces menziesii]